ERFDTVILNSVVQHFPSDDYLVALLRNVTPLVNEGGFIFLGDLRHYSSLSLFHTSVQWSQAGDGLPVSRLQRLIEQRVVEEQELAVDPQLFTTAGLDRVSRVQVQLKRGHHHNELTRFRYDVILEIGAAPAPAAACDSLDWGRQLSSVEQVSRLLRDDRPQAL